MTELSPLLRLNNGVEMPALGFGAMNTDAAAVTTALDVGYRLIDTAALYLNEREVGQGIREADVPRNEVFVITKLWLSDWGFDEALHAFDRSTGRLDVGALDLYLLHMPYPMDFGATVASYRAAERLLADGRVHAIGVSNFKPKHLDRLLAEVDVVPAVNQVELHPFFAQRDVRAKHSELGIVTQAWSPIGGVLLGQGVEVVKDPVLDGLAQSTARRARRSCCGGTSSTATPRFPSPAGPSALRRISTCSTSNSARPRWPRSTASMPVVTVDRIPTPSTSPSSPPSSPTDPRGIRPQPSGGTTCLTRFGSLTVSVRRRRGG